MTKKKTVKKDDTTTYDVTISVNLEKMIEGLAYDFVKLIIPSSQVLFKFLTLPLLDLEQIKMVVPFEIEQSLPFSLQEVSIDCIQLKKDNIKKESFILF